MPRVGGRVPHVPPDISAYDGTCPDNAFKRTYPRGQSNTSDISKIASNELILLIEVASELKTQPRYFEIDLVPHYLGLDYVNN